MLSTEKELPSAALYTSFTIVLDAVGETLWLFAVYVELLGVTVNPALFAFK